MWGVLRDPLPFSQVLRGLLPGGETVGKMQPSPLPLLTPPMPVPRFHLKLGMRTLPDHSVLSRCTFTSLLSLEIDLGRGDPGASGEDGSFIIPPLTSSSGPWHDTTLSWPSSPTAHLSFYFLMPFNSESAGRTGTFIRAVQLDLGYGKTGAKYATPLLGEQSNAPVKSGESSPWRFGVRS